MMSMHSSKPARPSSRLKAHHLLLSVMHLNCLSDGVSEKVNKQPEVINEAEVDCLRGRNWTEDPIQGNSDLWVITCNVLRRRAVSGCLSDSISPTQSSAIHSLCLNCPICFPHDAQLFLQPLPLHLPQQCQRERENHTLVNSFTHTECLCVAHKQVPTLHPASATQFLFSPLSDTHIHKTHLHLNCPAVGLYVLCINILFCD